MAFTSLQRASSDLQVLYIATPNWSEMNPRKNLCDHLASFLLQVLWPVQPFSHLLIRMLLLH